MKLHLGVCGVFAASCALFALGACSDDTGTATTTGGSSSSSSSGSSGMTSSSSSGSSGMTSSSSSGSSGMTSSSSSSSSGGGPYEFCSDCTSNTTGAYVKECKAKTDACTADPECQKLANCAYDTCATNAEGGCCALKCAVDLNTPAASKTLYMAMDNCVYCQTCTTLCESDPVSASGFCMALNGMTACP